MSLSSLPPPNEPLPLRQLADGEVLTVYRIVRTSDRTDPAFVDSFRSHAELGRPPRNVEVSHPAVHKGISAFDTREAAAETARRVARRGGALGDFVAAVPLHGVEGPIYYYWWGARGHLTIWGDPVKLSVAAADIVPIAADEPKKGKIIRGLHDSRQ